MGPGPDDEHGVYLKLAANIVGSLDDVTTQTIEAFRAAGWQLLADYQAGVDENDCSYGARVLVLNNDANARRIAQFGSDAAFAIPVRIGVFEDERGIQISATNPLSLNRTIVSETELRSQSTALTGEMRTIIGSVFPDHVSSAEYGQMRDRGLISRTMGLIAGGPFTDKIETLYSGRLDGETFSEFGERLYQGLADVGGSWRWGMRPVYKLELQSEQVIVIGMTGADMEARSFHIVGNGNDNSRGDLACPGIDHSAAYPIGLVISMDGDEVKVRAVDGMFRMKVFFEDAGNMKFAANMRMPGTIEDEIRDKVEEALNN